MNMRIFSSSRRFLRQAGYYGLFGVLGVLLLLLTVNDRNWRLLKGKSTWEVQSNYSGFSASLAVDLNLETAWSSHVPMEFGVYYRVNVGKPVTMNGLLLRVGKNRQGQPVRWVLKTSLDGEQWHTHVTGNGISHKSLLIIPFAAVRAQYIQLIQTSVSSSASPWLINEFDILQPVVPWQFRRGTLVLVIGGWLFFMLGVLVFPHQRTNVFSPPILTVIVLVILLSGWLLRIYDLDSYEFSAREYQRLVVLTFDKYTHGEWLRSYFDYSKTGTHWLALLCVRWAYQFSHSQFIAFRLVPALFSLISVILLYFLWRIFSQNAAAEWEALTLAMFISWSGWEIFLNRSGSFSATVICILLIYLLLTYHFLYRRGSYLLALPLAGIFCVGLFLHPFVSMVPVGILLFGLFHLLVCRRAPGLLHGGHLFLYSWRPNIRRLLIWLLSVAPGYVYWGMVAKKEGFLPPSREVLVEFCEELVRAIRFQGIEGAAALLFWGLVLVGTYFLLSHREHGEWWFVCLIGFTAAGSAVFFPEGQRASVSIVLLLLGVLAVRGLHEGLSFCYPRIIPERLPVMRMVCMAGVGLYFLLFSVNSFIGVSPLFPFGAEVRDTYLSKKTASALAKILREDSAPCKTVFIPNRAVALNYQENYGVLAQAIAFSEIQRLSEQGIFGTYLILLNDDAAVFDQHRRFAETYYTQIAGDARMRLYVIKEKFHNVVRRYYVRDLFFSIGHHREDEHASRRLVRVATPDDAPGLLSFGPFVRICEEGRYTARFALRSFGGKADETVVRLGVMSDHFGALARLELTGADFPDSEQYEIFELPFEIDFSENPVYPMKRLQFSVRATGKAEVRLDYIDVIPPDYEE